MRFWEIPAAVMGLYILSAGPAMAYIDPGTGSMLLQAIAALIISGSLALRMYWRTVREFFSRLFQAKKREGSN